MIFWTVCLRQGTSAPAFLRFPWRPDQQKGHGSLGLASDRSAATEYLSFCPAQQAFVLELEQQAGIALGSGCSEEVNTGCPVRGFALIQGELPDRKGYRRGGVWFLPWRSPTQRDKHPQARLAWRWPQEAALWGTLLSKFFPFFPSGSLQGQRSARE